MLSSQLLKISDKNQYKDVAHLTDGNNYSGFDVVTQDLFFKLTLLSEKKQEDIFSFFNPETPSYLRKTK